MSLFFNQLVYYKFTILLKKMRSQKPKIFDLDNNFSSKINSSDVKAISFKEILFYKYLIFMLIKKEFVVFYKQTVLGPFWYVLQPIINTIVFTIVFGKIAKIPTNGVPDFIFFMSGQIIWAYFAMNLQSSANIFVTNASLFKKIYFPRIVVPISIIIFNLNNLLIQTLIFFSFFIYFILNGSDLSFGIHLLYLPLVIINCMFLSLGFGLFFSSLTSKYRDFQYLLSFGVQLWMFLTPVIYSLNTIPERYLFYFYINPMSSIVETFRWAIFQNVELNINLIIFNLIISILLFLFGYLKFIKVEKNFIDTV